MIYFTHVQYLLIVHRENAKKRKAEETGELKVEGKLTLCHSLREGPIEGRICEHGTNCRHSHDIKAFMAQKPPDLGDECINYETYGYCSHGLLCRFGSKHIDKETFLNIKRDPSKGGVIERLEVNKMSTEGRKHLRKLRLDNWKIPFDDEVKQKLSEMGPGSANRILWSRIETPFVTTATATTAAPTSTYNNAGIFDKERKLVDFSGNKVYIAPLTTVGNLPFRRIMKYFGADITCGEMATTKELLTGGLSEWSLLRRHESEDTFGVQIAGGWPDMIGRLGSTMTRLGVEADFVDLNCGCPIDAMIKRGHGAALLQQHKRLLSVTRELCTGLPDRSVTVKIRTGFRAPENKRDSHFLVKKIQQQCFMEDSNGRMLGGNLAALFIHGRTRQQRYSKLADWSYIAECAKAQDSSLRRIPVIGNGDIFSYQDWVEKKDFMLSALGDDSEQACLTDCAMIGRGVLIKPWLPTEIKEQRRWDISATERMDMLKMYANYGLEHYGSDSKGVETTRRFMLEWLSFLYRYVPSGLIEENRQPQRINQIPPVFNGRCDAETLLGSANAEDWVKITEMFLGPRPDDFIFIPRHRSNAYATKEADEDGSSAAGANGGADQVQG